MSGVRPAVDLTVPRRVHLVGIGGTGMSVIGTLLVAMGHAVSGSDVAETPVTGRLRALGAAVRIGHDPAAVDDADVVTASSAVPGTNVELAAAAARGVPVLSRGQLLGAICATRRTLAVSGTHGKTTTTSMLWSILREAGWHPSCIVGGDLHGIGHGAVWDPEGEWMVVEADESDGTFLDLPAEGAVVTNVGSDHLEFYGGLEPLRQAFAAFLQAASGARVTNADDPGARAMAALVGDGPPVTTFGTAAGASVVLSDVALRGDGSRATVTVDGALAGTVELAVPGRHNLANAAAALALALRRGVPWDAAARALASFREVARRFEGRGEAGGVRFVDDYAHNPSKVRAALATARIGGWGRVVAVFQPHRYSRTAALQAEFADAFVDADVLVVTGIYPAGEAPRPGVTGRLIHDAVRAAHPEADVRYVERREDVAGVVAALLRPGDLCLSLGAGDITALADELRGAGPAPTSGPPEARHSQPLQEGER